MQIIEVTDLGVRSAVIRLRHRETALQFVLYPMIHMAKPAFYAAVTARLRQADVVVVEGVGGGGREGSVLVGALTLSYRVLRFNRRAKLVEQDIDYAALGVPVIRPDVSQEEFAAGWRRVPLAHRLIVWCVLPVDRDGAPLRRYPDDLVAVDGAERPALAGGGGRRRLVAGMEAAFGGERDDRLLAVLCRLHEERGGEGIEVAVVYGAGHVPAIVRG